MLSPGGFSDSVDGVLETSERSRVYKNNLNHNSNSESNKVKVRKYFPETWLWESATAG